MMVLPWPWDGPDCRGAALPMARLSSRDLAPAMAPESEESFDPVLAARPDWVPAGGDCSPRSEPDDRPDGSRAPCGAGAAVRPPPPSDPPPERWPPPWLRGDAWRCAQTEAGPARLRATTIARGLRVGYVGFFGLCVFRGPCERPNSWIYCIVATTLPGFRGDK